MTKRLQPQPAKPTLLDRMIGYVSPEAGLKRAQARTMLTMSGGYKGGRKDRRQTRGFNPGEGSADADLLPQLADLRARSRDLARNMPIATGTIATNVTMIVGSGLVPRATIDHKALGITQDAAAELGRKAEIEWSLFAKSLDFTSVQAECDLQALVLRGVFESGDIFAVRRYRMDPGDTYGTKVQILEADRVSNPNYSADRGNLAGGVQIDGNGKPVAYHATNRHPGAVNPGRLEWRPIPARYRDGRPVVLHLFDRLRPDQSRGIPYLAPVIELVMELGTYTEAEARSAVVSSWFTVFVRKPSIGDDGPLPPTSLGEPDDIELGPGAVIDLAEGEDITIANPGRPNPAFDAFVTALLRQIGVALEIPFEVLVKHFTSSYTAGRAALELAWTFWRRRRAWMARSWCQPLWEWMWEEAVATGRLSAPGFFEDAGRRQAYLWTDWIGPTRISLDPLKDAKADDVDLAGGAKTLAQVSTERTGGDWESNILQRGRELALARENGLIADPASAGSAGRTADPMDATQ